MGGLGAGAFGFMTGCCCTLGSCFDFGAPGAGRPRDWMLVLILALFTAFVFMFGGALMGMLVGKSPTHPPDGAPTGAGTEHDRGGRPHG